MNYNETIDQFAAEMKRQMKIHGDELTGWENLTIQECLLRITCLGHLSKLQSALTNQDQVEARKQAAHAANFLMFVFSKLEKKDE